MASFYIPRGSAGTRATLAAMRDIAVQDWEQARERWGIHVRPRQLESFFRDHWIFIPDGMFETIRFPRENGDMQGDCDDAAAVVGAILTGQFYSHFDGLRSAAFVALRHPASLEFNHVLTIAEDRDGTFIIDPTAPPEADYTRWEQMVQPIF